MNSENNKKFHSEEDFEDFISILLNKIPNLDVKRFHFNQDWDFSCKSSDEKNFFYREDKPLFVEVKY